MGADPSFPQRCHALGRASAGLRAPKGGVAARVEGQGERPGHPGARRKVPRRIDRTVEYAPPKRCACGGAVTPTDKQRSTLVEDIPVPVRAEVVKHVAHV